MIRDVVESYRQALRFLWPFLATHVFFRMASTAILVPLIGGLLTLTLWFSNQSALTDQDIARFLLTPAGFLGALLVASALVAAMVLDVAVMTVTLRAGRSQPFDALRTGVEFAVANIAALARVAAALWLRVLLIALPFLALSGLLYFTRLSEFDINYYLTEHPPEFITTILLIGLLLAVMAAILISRLTSWAYVLHVVLFERRAPREAFRISRERMAGHRVSLVFSLGLWAAIRFGIGSGISAVAAFGLAAAPELTPDSLARSSIVILLVLLLSLAATTVLNAFSNGALASLLNARFEPHEDAEGETNPRMRSVTGTRGLALICAGLVGVSILGTIGSLTALSGRLTTEAEVEVIGHRGAAALRPENTMASVIKAIEDGADWVEIDVQESADGEVIVVHDSDFMKAAGNPIKVWDAHTDDLKDIDIGSWFDSAYADERVPTLRDVLLAAKGRSKVIIELKYYGHDVDLENRVFAVVEETGMEADIAIMSLKYPAVQKTRELRPDWRTGVLAATAVGDLTGLEGDFLAVSSAQVSAKLVARANAAGKDVYVWTVNDAVSMSRMISIGADGLITDDPALAQQVIAERNALSVTARFALWLSDSFGVAVDRISGEVVEQ